MKQSERRKEHFRFCVLQSRVMTSGLHIISLRHRMMKCEKIRELPICSKKYRRIDMTGTRRITVGGVVGKPKLHGFPTTPPTVIPSSIRSRFVKLMLLIVGISSAFPAVTISQQSRTQIVM